MVETKGPTGPPHGPAPSLWPLGFAIGLTVALVGLVIGSWSTVAVGAVLLLAFGFVPEYEVVGAEAAGRRIVRAVVAVTLLAPQGLGSLFDRLPRRSRQGDWGPDDGVPGESQYVEMGSNMMEQPYVFTLAFYASSDAVALALMNDLRDALKAFVRAYAFLGQVMKFTDDELEALYLYGKHIERPGVLAAVLCVRLKIHRRKLVHLFKN